MSVDDVLAEYIVANLGRAHLLHEDDAPTGHTDPSGDGGLWQALALSALAAAGLVAGWVLLSGWRRSSEPASSRTGNSPSTEALIDELSDEEKQQLLDEMSGHV